MNTREKILEAVLNNQPPATPLPDLAMFRNGGPGRPSQGPGIVQQYIDIFRGIGGQLFCVDELDAVKTLIGENFDTSKRLVTTLPELGLIAELYQPAADPHSFKDVELAIIRANLAVAENGAVWLTEDRMGQRILPFICQHLAVIVDTSTIVPTMHEAYEQIGVGNYGFGGFIGGPSKTADIEQALVLGAHGPITMTVFLIK